MPDPAAPAVEWDAVAKKLGRSQALSDFSLAVGRGQITVVLGPNGAGKTTALSLVVGLRRPDHGVVRVLGGDPRSRRMRRAIGTAPQDVSFPFTIRVGELVDFARAHHIDPYPATEILGWCGLDALERRQAGGLSGGGGERRRRAAAARARDRRATRAARPRRAHQRPRHRGSCGDVAAARCAARRGSHGPPDDARPDRGRTPRRRRGGGRPRRRGCRRRAGCAASRARSGNRTVRGHAGRRRARQPVDRRRHHAHRRSRSRRAHRGDERSEGLVRRLVVERVDFARLRVEEAPLEDAIRAMSGGRPDRPPAETAGDGS